MERAEKWFWVILTLAVLFFVACNACNGDEFPNLPPLGIAKSLPSHKICVEAEELCKKVHESIDDKWKEAAYKRWNIWWYAELATNEKMLEEERRGAIAWLIRHTSWKEVLTGQLPSPIPFGKVEDDSPKR